MHRIRSSEQIIYEETTDRFFPMLRWILDVQQTRYGQFPITNFPEDIEITVNFCPVIPGAIPAIA